MILISSWAHLKRILCTENKGELVWLCINSLPASPSCSFWGGFFYSHSLFSNELWLQFMFLNLFSFLRHRHDFNKGFFVNQLSSSLYYYIFSLLRSIWVHYVLMVTRVVKIDQGTLNVTLEVALDAFFWQALSRWVSEAHFIHNRAAVLLYPFLPVYTHTYIYMFNQRFVWKSSVIGLNLQNFKSERNSRNHSHCQNSSIMVTSVVLTV